MAEITAAMVRQLRDSTGIGMMDCKKALQESDGDMEKAVDFLRKQGMSAVEKRAGRDANEGVIASYIHPGSRLGVLLEVNCETDFVARTDDFQEFTRDVAMHIAAEQPTAVGREDVDPALIEKEKEIYLEQAKNEGKPENIAEKIVQGRLEKYYQEVCLLEQAFVKDPDKTIDQMLTELTAKIGEKLSIRRFACFRLGE
ncbi:MAG: translation elongation factor Ts [Gemmatimonadetes bacterium]|jgi:elongation factor Ts|nr:translation elongation factor Ts [Gemmatimonadota bacterium]MBT5060494.1 translation elongation factor Ts [Gemmatimonadota bacterium]MBT5142535.1 translation elongation factor Ts [Gemmatimonadota bacterium]MBT5587168.1 translation elongation factor Ts [Gemmatimonadota bacterium]MBT5961168.1 translation elongation factor Ts [Gemmatimonadota bacterium]